MENRDYIVAIDLGSNTVVAVIGSKDDNGKIKVFDAEVTSVEGMVRSEIKNIEQVAASIKKTVEAIEVRQDIKIKEAYAGISGQHIRCVKYPYFVFVGNDGEIREEDVRKLHENMSNVQAPDNETIVEIIPQNYIVDNEETANPVGTFGNKLEATFNFILCDTNAANRINRALARVDLRQSGLFLNAISSAEAVATVDEKEEGVAIIDIGGGTTDVTIFYKGKIRHVGIVPMGGNTINKDIRSYGILERHVENLKVKYGSALREKVTSDKLITTPGLNARISKDISTLNLASIIEARMLDIIDFIMEEIKRSGYSDRLGAGIILTGGCAQLKDLDALFKSYTGIETRVAAADTTLAEGSIEAASNPAFATAVGLLVKAFEGNKAPKAQRPRPAASQVQDTYAEYQINTSPVRKRALNEIYTETEPKNEEGFSSDTFEEQEKEKGGFFKKFKKKIDNMFDVIEDNEI